MTDDSARTSATDSSGSDHPIGFEGHEDVREMDVVELGDVSGEEIISRSIVVLMSAAAEKLGLSEEDPSTSEKLDLDDARKLITALAGLVTASAEWLGPQASAMRDGLQGLQLAFREASAYPDPPGQGPGEKYTGKVY